MQSWRLFSLGRFQSSSVDTVHWRWSPFETGSNWISVFRPPATVTPRWRKDYLCQPTFSRSTSTLIIEVRKNWINCASDIFTWRSISLATVDKSRIFVTTPRFSEGVPVTLGFVGSAKTDLLIHPYPDYSWHSSHGSNCDGLTSVVRVAIDSCHQLWVLDTGVIGETRKCPPQLVVFNLRNDKLIRRYKFPKSQYTDTSLHITPVRFVQTRLLTRSIISVLADRSSTRKTRRRWEDAQTPKSTSPTWRVLHSSSTIMSQTNRGKSRTNWCDVKLGLKSAWFSLSTRPQFYPYPSFGTFTIAGESFDLMDGIFGLAISPRKSSDDNSNAVAGSLRRKGTEPAERLLYFHSLASGHENSVPLRILNDASIWHNDANAQPRAFKEIGRRDIQTAGSLTNFLIYFESFFWRW